MVELLAVWVLSSRLAGVAAAKGRPKKLGLLAMAGWLVGEFFGLSIGVAVGLPTLAAYGLGLAVAAMLTAIAFRYVRGLPMVSV